MLVGDSGSNARPRSAITVFESDHDGVNRRPHLQHALAPCGQRLRRGRLPSVSGSSEPIHPALPIQPRSALRHGRSILVPADTGGVLRECRDIKCAVRGSSPIQPRHGVTRYASRAFELLYSVGRLCHFIGNGLTALDAWAHRSRTGLGSPRPWTQPRHRLLRFVRPRERVHLPTSRYGRLCFRVQPSQTE